MIIKLNLQMFAEDGAPASPAATEGGGAETAAAGSTGFAAGDSLPDGQNVQSAQVAAELNRQMKRHPELRKVYGQDNSAATQPAQAEAPAPAEKTIDERWEELKKGEYAQQYGRDVQAAIQDRFKNARDTQGELDKLAPMLEVLRNRAGVQSNDELISKIMDDDSLYEEEADKHGMTVEAYKLFRAQQQQLQEAQKREAESLRDQQLRGHYNTLVQQAEELKKSYPGFDLQKELQDERFFRMTSIEGGVSVEDAFFALHRAELAPQMMAYGMQRAKEQMGQTLQANRRRPAEGAAKPGGQPSAPVAIDPRKLTRRERDELRRQIHNGKVVSFG